tara:strand:- start:12 stop:371 length:360 start_codon:yes stop_codon:yes gene_type:complete
LSLLDRNLAKYGQSITLHNRDISPPLFGQVDFDEEFTGDQTVTAIIKTERGKTLFDGVATDTPITHQFCIKYVDGVTAETWITFKGRKFNIIDVENCCEKDNCLILRSSERGLGEASKA